MNYKHLILFFLCSIPWYGCEECPGCEERVKEARINIQFKADATKVHAQGLVDSLSALLEQDRILIDSIENPAMIDSLTTAIAELESDSTKYSEWLDLFRRGKTAMGQIFGEGASDVSVFEDTVISADFSLPLDMNRDESTYYFNYHNLTDTLKLVYKREVVQGIDGIRMRIFDLGFDASLTTFDSTVIRCIGVDCSNSRSFIEVYF